MDRAKKELLEKTMAEVESLTAEQIEAMRENVKGRLSDPDSFDRVLRLVAFEKLVNAIVSLEPYQKTDALEFAVKALTLISDMRSMGASDNQIMEVLQGLEKELDERKSKNTG